MNTEAKNNYYEVLNISENATQQEIHMAYEKAKKTYSAENKALRSVFTEEEAGALRQLVEEAYEVLSNHTYRNIYERRMLGDFNNDDLSAQAIKAASENIFQRVVPPMVEEVVAEDSFSTASTPENLKLQPTRNVSYEDEMAAKKDWTGDDLRKMREYRQLSYDELTDITKINPWYIAAIENMDPSNLPVEVFVRGYVLQIAKALGLKEKTVADSYMRIFRKKIEN